MWTIAMWTIVASLARADDANCSPLTAYPIGRSGIVRLTWPQFPDADPKTTSKNVRYAVLRGLVGGALHEVAVTAYDPITNVVLDEVPTDGKYVYKLQIDIIDPTGAAELVSSKTQDKKVNIPTLQAKTLIAETFDCNRLDPNRWKAPLTTNWKIESGFLVLAPKVQMPIQPVPPGYTLSKNGLDIVARVMVTSQNDKNDKVDEIAAAIGFETNDPSDPGYILKLAMHHNCKDKKVQLQFTSKTGSTNDPTWGPFAAKATAPDWTPGQFIWLKLKIDRVASKATAWAWKDGEDAPEFDDDNAAIDSFDFAAYGYKKAGSLQGSPTLYGDAGTASFGEVIIEDLLPPPAPAPPPPPVAPPARVVPPPPGPTTWKEPERPGHEPAQPGCSVAKLPEQPARPCPEPPPGLRFCRHWPNSAVAVNLSEASAPAGKWKLSQRGLSVKPLDRTVEDDIRLAGGERSSDGFGPADPDRASPTAAFQKEPDHLFVFLGPAMFPLPRYQDFSPPFEDDGATIRESMNVRASDSGKFEVEFFVMAPALPVTLRLQLALHRGSEDLGLITLPPIVLDPQQFRRDEQQGDTWRVVYHGYSRSLAQAMDWCCLDTHDPIEITRHGAARFGSGVNAVGIFDQQ